MKVIIYWHRNCLDGATACWSVLRKFAEDLNIPTIELSTSTLNHIKAYPVEYNITIPDIEVNCKDADVYLVDFSVPPDVLNQMASVANKVVVLDHHASAIKKLDGYTHPKVELVLDTTQSGAMLAWKYMWRDTPAPTLLKFVQDNDLWTHQYPQSKPIVRGIYQSGIIQSEDWSRFDQLAQSEDALIDMIELGTTVIDTETKLITKVLEESSYYVFLKGHKGVAVGIPYSLSTSAGGIVNSFQDVNYSISHDLVAREEGYPAGYHRFSLRSNKDWGIDVSKIAECFGGGGHKNAAGFKVSKLHFNTVEDFFKFHEELTIPYSKDSANRLEYQYFKEVKEMMNVLNYNLRNSINLCPVFSIKDVNTEYQRILETIELSKSLEDREHWEKIKDKVKLYNETMLKAHAIYNLIYNGTQKTLEEAGKLRDEMVKFAVSIDYRDYEQYR